MELICFRVNSWRIPLRHPETRKRYSLSPEPVVGHKRNVGSVFLFLSDVVCLFVRSFICLFA